MTKLLIEEGFGVSSFDIPEGIVGGFFIQIAKQKKGKIAKQKKSKREDCEAKKIEAGRSMFSKTSNPKGPEGILRSIKTKNDFFASRSA